MKKMLLGIALVALFGLALLGLSAPAAHAQSIQVFTLANNGQAASLNPRTEFALDLGPDYLWQVSVANPYGSTPVVVMLRWSNGSTANNHSMGLFETIGYGKAVITARGIPRCEVLARCRLPEQLFTFTVIVPTNQ